MRLRCAPDQAQPLNGSDRLVYGGAIAPKVKPRHPKCGHLTEPDGSVGEEEHGEPIRLVRTGVHATVLAGLRWMAGRDGEIVDLLVSQVTVLGPTHRRTRPSFGMLQRSRDRTRRAPGVSTNEVQDQGRDVIEVGRR